MWVLAGKFLASFGNHWVSWASGIVGVILWIIGAAADSFNWGASTKLLFLIGAALATALSCFSVWREEYLKRQNLENRLAGLPILRMSTRAFSSDTFYINGIDEEYSCIHLNLVNTPTVHTHESVARGVRANIAFYDEAGAHLLEFPGRWSDTPQPHAQDQRVGRIHYESLDIQIGQTVSLDIAMKRLSEDLCYGVNNECFSYPHLQNSRFKLPAGKLRCEVRITAPYIDSTFRLLFESKAGPLAIISHDGPSPTTDVSVETARNH
jgi:hypothetical protein